MTASKKPARKHNGRAEWVTIGGQRFYARSQLERRHAEFLEVQRRAGLIVSWQHEPHTFHFPNVKSGPASYKPDFRVVHADGYEPAEAWHETKGHWTRRDVSKLRLMARHHPEVTIVVVGAPLTPDDRGRIEAARARTIREREAAARKAEKKGRAA